MQDIVLNGLIAFSRVDDDVDIRQCISRAVEGMLDEYAEQRRAGLPGWGYTSCPFMLRPGPVRHLDRVDERHSFGAIKSYLSVYEHAAETGTPESASRVERLLHLSRSRFNAPLPTQGKMFAQATRWMPLVLKACSKISDGEQHTSARRP